MSSLLAKSTIKDKRPRNVFWLVLTALFITISLGFMIEIAKRFLTGGRDWLSLVSSIVQPLLYLIQAGLALLAAGTLTDPGRQWAEKLLNQLKLYDRYGAKRRFVIAAVVLILMLAFRLSLPAFARHFVKQGNHLIFSNQARAREYYQRALSLNPDSAEAHFGLGVAYEMDRNYEDAETEYKKAIDLDSKYLDPHNNLARLYLWEEDKLHFDRSLEHLNDAIASSPPDWEIAYVLYKNRGWAYYALARYEEAERDLKKAVEIDQNRPGRVDDSEDLAMPHCLLGEVFTKTNRRTQAVVEWQDCLRFSTPAAGRPEYLKDEWLKHAQQYLKDGHL
jgi:tetratricopeptide (TPR) repeat protein